MQIEGDDGENGMGFGAELAIIVIRVSSSQGRVEGRPRASKEIEIQPNCGEFTTLRRTS